MSLTTGIVGLPNVGKSTIFNALTCAGARVESFPFCTIEPNHGIVPVPDRRLNALMDLLSPPKVTPATLEVVDIAGLVKGAHKGEGLGNQFLGHVRAVDAVLHVLRCFGGEVAHVDGSVDAIRDRAVVELELAMADLDIVERRLEKSRKEARVGLEGAANLATRLERFEEALGSGRPLRDLDLDDPDRQLARELGLLTAMPVLYVVNVDEEARESADGPLAALREHLAADGVRWIELLADMEAEIAELDDPEEQALFREDLGLAETSLDVLAREAYALLGLISFYTFVGGKELRAWSIPEGTTAPGAAGRIHTDFERGFIRAEVASVDTYLEHGGEAGVRAAGLLRSEGKDYLVRDGDVVRFRFNV
jgi:GTP-binding protein YchF